MKENQDCEPEPPHHHLVHRLDVQDAEHKDELIEDEIPEFVLQVLKMEAKINKSKFAETTTP